MSSGLMEFGRKMWTMEGSLLTRYGQPSLPTPQLAGIPGKGLGPAGRCLGAKRRITYGRVAHPCGALP